MTMGPDLRIATLNDARSRRSAEKRAAVEDAIMRLRETRQAVTFVSVAREAKVSRQYLYNNFADEIGESQPSPEELLDARARSFVTHQQDNRDRAARNWWQARAELRAIPDVILLQDDGTDLVERLFD